MPEHESWCMCDCDCLAHKPGWKGPGWPIHHLPHTCHRWEHDKLTFKVCGYCKPSPNHIGICRDHLYNRTGHPLPSDEDVSHDLAGRLPLSTASKRALADWEDDKYRAKPTYDL